MEKKHKRDPYAIIRPVGYSNSSGAITLSGIYQDEKLNNTYLLQNKMVATPANFKDGKLAKGLHEIQIRFSHQTMQYNIEEDADGAHKKESEWWSNHTLVNVVGKPKKRGAKFEMEIVGDVKAEKLSEAKRILMAMTYVESLKEHALKDVMYFFGTSPVNMSKDDIFLRLCDPKGGLLMDKGNRDLFLKTHVEEGANRLSKQIEIEIYINKAVDAGYLDRKEKGFLFLDSVLIGGNKETQVDWFLSNPVEYTNMKRALSDLGYAKRQPVPKVVAEVVEVDIDGHQVEEKEEVVPVAKKAPVKAPTKAEKAKAALAKAKAETEK